MEVAAIEPFGPFDCAQGKTFAANELHAYAVERVSIGGPEEAQLLQVSGQALNRHVGTGLRKIHGGSVNPPLPVLAPRNPGAAARRPCLTGSNFVVFR